MIQDYSYGIVPLRQRKGAWQTLLVQHQAGHWAFPKGHPEQGESPKQTAERELTEETGLVVSRYLSEEPLIETYVFFFQSQKIYKSVEYFVAEVEGRVRIQEAEIANSRWLSLQEAEQVVTFQESKKICLTVKTCSLKLWSRLILNAKNKKIVSNRLPLRLCSIFFH